jgi:hypothetical protein
VSVIFPCGAVAEKRRAVGGKVTEENGVVTTVSFADTYDDGITAIGELTQLEECQTWHMYQTEARKETGRKRGRD